MGIKNLSKFIKLFAPNAITHITLADLQHKTIAFDTSILLYQVVIAILNSGSPITNIDGVDTSHIHAIIMKTLSFLKKQINPIFVFDGIPTTLKNTVLLGRTTLKDNAIVSLQTDSLTYEHTIQLLKQSVHISQIQMNECKEILSLIGMPFITAIEEADCQCAYLSKQNIVQYVASEDMDLLVFGTKELIRGISHTDITKINLNTILTDCNISMDQFIDICILLGCDYCTTIEGIGLQKAYSLIKKFNSIENIIVYFDTLIKKNKTINISIEFRNNYQNARNYFKNHPVVSDVDNLQWKHPNYDALLNILINKYSYSSDTVHNLFNNQFSNGYYSKLMGHSLSNVNNIFDNNNTDLFLNDDNN